MATNNTIESCDQWIQKERKELKAKIKAGTIAKDIARAMGRALARANQANKLRRKAEQIYKEHAEWRRQQSST